MSGFRIEGDTSGNTAEVDAGKHLLTNLGKDTTTAGYAVMMSEKDAGTVTGTPYMSSPEVSEDYRLRVGMDTILLSAQFNHISQDFNKFQNVITTAGTMTYAAGYLVLTTTTANSIGVMEKSWSTFPVFGASQTWYEMSLNYGNPLVAGTVIEFGAGLTTTAIAAVTDGAFFRYSGTDLLAVVSYNTNERISAVIPVSSVPAVGITAKYSISCSGNEAEFWIDDILVATLAAPTGYPGISSCNSLPAFVRVYNNSVASIQIVRIADIVVSLADLQTSKPWAHQCSGMGNNCIAAPLTGYTANYANSAAPAGATVTNLVAGYATLGGQFANLAGTNSISETDYIMFAYLNPLPTVAITSRTMYITGVWIDTWITTAAVGAVTPTILQWAIGIGCSTITLVTADGVVTKAARRLPLGAQSWPLNSVIGTMAQNIDRKFDSPLVVNPGEYVHIMYKVPIGTLGPVSRGIVGINAYWE